MLSCGCSMVCPSPTQTVTYRLSLMYVYIRMSWIKISSERDITIMPGTVILWCMWRCPAAWNHNIIFWHIWHLFFLIFYLFFHFLKFNNDMVLQVAVHCCRDHGVFFFFLGACISTGNIIPFRKLFECWQNGQTALNLIPSYVCEKYYSFERVFGIFEVQMWKTFALLYNCEGDVSWE